MAIYRSNTRRSITIVGIVALVVGLVGGVVIGRLSAPGLDGQLGELRAAALPIAGSLEVIRAEYPESLVTGADTGGAPGALARARTTYDLLTPRLILLDPAATAVATAALVALEAGVAGKASEADVGARIDAFRAALATALGTAAR